MPEVNTPLEEVKVDTIEEKPAEQPAAPLFDEPAATCTGYSSEGAGVTRINDVVIFVPGLLVGEEAEIGITKMKSSYGYGRVVKILKPSEHRVEPKCSVYRPCGGCQLQHMDDFAQREFKMEKVKDRFP